MLSSKLDNAINIVYFLRTVKNALSILFLFAWGLFHYIRILTFWQCPLATTSSQSSITAVCDCERLAVATPTGNTGPSAERTLARPAPEDPFTKEASFTFSGYMVKIHLPGSGLTNSRAPAGFKTTIFQPPRC